MRETHIGTNPFACPACHVEVPQMETDMTATINRYRIPLRTGRFAWKYGYEAYLDGVHYSWGDHPLASLRRLLKGKGATEIIEAWKGAE